MDAMANKEAGQIYNVDEYGMLLDHCTPCVLTTKGEKVRYHTSGNKSQITLIGYVNATGQTIPPFVIFAKSMNM